MEHNRKNQNVRVNLPKEFKLKKYQIGDENYWAKLETDIGDFNTIESALKYFKNNYMIELEKIKNNCFFIIKNITLLSTGEKLEFERSDTKLTVKANSRFSDNYPICFKIEID